MHLSKVQLFSSPLDDVPTRFRNFCDVKIAISYEETVFFPVFLSRHIEFLRPRNSIVATNSERAHAKIVGDPF